MKQPVARFATRTLAFVSAAACFTSAGIATVSAQADGSAAAEESVAAPRATAPPANARADKKQRRNRQAEDASPTPREKGTKKDKDKKELDFPLAEGMPAKKLRIPETDPTGLVLSQLMAAQATRIDNEHVEMKEMKMDLNHPDGKEDFHILLPTSIFNLQTRIISSRDPVTVRTQDFELTGEGMEFNTVERSGKLLGKVRMLIHNLKQTATQAQPTPQAE